MLLNSLIFLLLSNSITSRRDKSILYSRTTITILLISAFIAFIPFFLQWSILCFYKLIFLTLVWIFAILFIHSNSDINVCNCNGTTLGIFVAYYVYHLEITVSDSCFNDTYKVIFIVIGLSMIYIDFMFNPKKMSFLKVLFYFFKNKDFIFTFVMKNKMIVFILGLLMLFIFFLGIFSINMFLWLVGLDIIVSTASPTLFFYTFFSKVTSIRLVITFLFCSITKKIELDNVSLSLSSVIFMFLLGTVNCYYLMPYVRVIMSFVLTNLDNAFRSVCLFIENSSIIVNNYETLGEGIYNIMGKFPVIGRYLGAFRMNNSSNNVSHNLRRSYDNPFKHKINITPLATISRFNNQYVFRIIPHNMEVSYNYKGSSSHLNLLLSNNTIYLKGVIKNSISKYFNLTCSIKFKCFDETVSIKSIIKKGYLEEFDLNRTNILFDNSFKYADSFYDTARDKVKQLLCLTDPSNIGSDLQVFMEKDSSNTSDNISLNMGERKMVEFEDYPYTGEEYDCIKAKLYLYDNQPRVLLDFDPNMLLEKDYLIDLLIKGRTVIFEHYLTKNLSDKDIINCLDEFKFEHLNMGFENNDKDYIKLHNAFLEKCKDIMTPKNIKHDNIKPFSADYIDYLQKPRLNIAEANISGLASSSISDEVYPPVSDLAEASSFNVVDNTSLDKEHGLEPAEIRALLNELRSRQKIFYFSKKINGIAPNLYKLGISTRKGIYLDNGEINAITRTLDKVCDWLPSKTSVNYICLELHKLLEDRVINPLTNAEFGTVYEGLKSRMNNRFNDRLSPCFHFEECWLEDLNFISSDRIILELTSKNIDNDFTYLLTKLVATQQRLFENSTGKFVFYRVSLYNLCYRLFHLSNPEKLTKSEMSLVVNGLETRKAAIRLGQDNFGHLKLLIKTGIIYENFKSNDFTDLLDRLYYQDSNVFSQNFSETNVYTFINKVKNKYI